MAENERERRIAFAYERAPNKTTIAATGAYGGPSPDANSVVAHLYVEHISVPAIISHPVGDEGQIDLAPENADAVSRADATREIQATLVLSPEAAIVIGQWLVVHGETAKSRRGGT